MTPPINGEVINSVESARKQIESKKILIKEAEYIAEALSNIKQEAEEKVEEKEYEESLPLLKIQQEILDKAQKGLHHHRHRMMEETNQLVKNKDKASLEKLNSNIDFTTEGGVIINTPHGQLRFKPQAPTYDDIKDIEGIKLNKNTWTENPITGEKGLWVNFDAVKKITKSGKKITKHDNRLWTAANIFQPDNGRRGIGYEKLNTLLGNRQKSFRNYDGNRENEEFGLGLWLDSPTEKRSCALSQYKTDYGYNPTLGLGIWFMEE